MAAILKNKMAATYRKIQGIFKQLELEKYLSYRDK